MAEHYSDRDQKYYTQDYVNALTGTSKMFLKQATAENKALRKKVKNMRKTVKQQGKCIKRMGAKIAGLDRDARMNDNFIKNDYLHFVNWHKYAKEQMNKYHVTGGSEGLSIRANCLLFFYRSPNMDDRYSILNPVNNKIRFVTNCTQYDWLCGTVSPYPKVYSPFGEDFILVEWLDAPNDKSLIGWINVEPRMNIHFCI